MSEAPDPVVVAYFCNGVFRAYEEILRAPSLPMAKALDTYQDDVQGQVELIQRAICDCGLILAAFDEHLREVVAGQVHPAYEVYEPLGKTWLHLKCGADFEQEMRYISSGMAPSVCLANLKSFGAAFEAFSLELAKIITPHQPYRS